MKRILLWFVCATMVAAISGCNTVRGVGKDIEKAGHKIQKVAD